MEIKKKNRGSLRKAMGAKKGEKLSVAEMQKKKKNAGPAMKKKLTFALNARKWKHELGGLIYPYALGGLINAEIEKQEVVVPPNGIQAGIRRKYNLPSHKNATSENVIAAQPGSFVVSDKLMYDDNKTFAQAYEEADKKSDRYRKILDNPKSTSLAIKTSKRNLDNIKKLQEQIIEKNQAMLYTKGAKKGYAEGGLLDKIPGAGLMQLAPIASNLISGIFGKEDKLNSNDYQNPYANKAMSLMSNRRLDANPMLEANASASAVANYNLRNAGLGAGAYAANRLGVQNNRMRADSQALYTQQQANNAYRGDEAQFSAGIGQQIANTRLNIKDINDRNLAAKKDMFNTAMGQLGQFGQTQQLMSNQKNRDEDMMTRWQDYLNMLVLPTKTISNQQINPAGYTD